MWRAEIENVSVDDLLSMSRCGSTSALTLNIPFWAARLRDQNLPPYPTPNLYPNAQSLALMSQAKDRRSGVKWAFQNWGKILKLKLFSSSSNTGLHF
jgi:hypothetical protein